MARRRTVYGNEELQTLSRLTLSDRFNMIRGDALIRTKQDSASPDQGALVVRGGVGIGMSLSVGGEVQCDRSQKFQRRAPSFNVHCNELTLNCTDTVKGVSIVTQNDGVPFFFGNQNSTCTFNGKFVLVRGDLQVMGNTTTINSQIVDMEDHQIELGIIADPNDTTANGGGIVLKGSTDKSLLWYKASGLWTFNTGVDIQAGSSLHADAISGKSVGLTLSDGTTDVLTLLGGRLGVNATAPRVTFDIQDTDAIHIDQARTTYISVESDDNTTDVHRIRFFVQGVEVSQFDPSGKLGLGTTTPAVRLDIQDTDAVHIPVGSTAQRPNSAIVETGMIRYNTDLHRYEGYTQADVWGSLGGLIDQAQTTYITVESDDNTTDVHRIRFFVQGVEVSNFDPTGRLGLGTTTPAVRLDIQDTDAIHIRAPPPSAPTLPSWRPA
ncbi:g7805 [Coccomyxa viridis]|uniref:G7805 protein n=1 Tax=Coccomyxa viridis TaxID=1274662 RepID=A0ABP1G5C0_9CHLO